MATASRSTTPCRWSPRHPSRCACSPRRIADAFADFTTRLLRSLDAAETVDDASTADLAIAGYDPLLAGRPDRATR